MSDALLILSIGPVQGFIAQARRAADLYTGSQLLAQFVNAAIDEIGEDKVLYPRRVQSQRPRSLPNKLIARLPAAQAVEIARQAEERIQERWQELAEPAKARLTNLVPPDDEWENMWTTQLVQLPEIYWTVTPWKEGLSYAQVYQQANRDFDARKRLRNFTAIEEQGRKCTVCGERAALHRKGEKPRAYWSAIAGKVGEAKLRSGGKEQLCAICAVKRFGELGQEHFPSVSEMATVPFKRVILRQLQGDTIDLDSHQALVHVLERFVQSLSQAGIPSIDPEVVPTLSRMLESTLYGETLKKLLRHDGEWLFPETYERKLAEVGSSSPQVKPLIQAQNATRNLLQIAQKLGLTPHRPSPYYALLVADGDQMGKQIQKAAAEGPDKHRAISQALAEFADKQVYNIVEEKHAGRVIYAGGDDVLALLPLSSALAAAEDLRKAYTRKMSGLLESPTMSAGIAIAHHLSPLGKIVAAARQAEHAAKDEYDRNAVSVIFRKRSGAPVTMGAKWTFGDNAQATINLLLDIQVRFSAARDNSQKEKGLSLRLAHTFLNEARYLGGNVPLEARQAEVERLLYRAAPARLAKEVRRRQAKDLSLSLVQLASSIENCQKGARERQRNASCLSLPLGELEPGLVTVARWLLLLRFTVQETGTPEALEGERL